MESDQLGQAIWAAMEAANALGLPAEDAELLHNSNRIAIRLSPCHVLARVAPRSFQATGQATGNDLELRMAGRLVKLGAPVAGPDPRVAPRVFERAGFAITFWTYFVPVPPDELAPDEYARTMAAVHAAMRAVDADVPHFTDRVAEARTVVTDRSLSPELADADRAVLMDALVRLGTSVRERAPRHQVLHGEPHLGNLLRTQEGLLLIDFETVCRGPVEFDIAHSLLPNENGTMFSSDLVSEHYPGADRELVEQCRTLIWAMITSWRWRHDDQLPNRDHWRVEGLRQLRLGLAMR